MKNNYSTLGKVVVEGMLLTEFEEFINANIEGKQIAFTKYIDKLLGGYVSILNSILLHDDFENFGKGKYFEKFQFLSQLLMHLIQTLKLTNYQIVLI